MIIDGRAIAKDVEERLSAAFAELELSRVPKVSFITFGDDPATKSFLKIKQKVAERIGVSLQIHELPENVLEGMAQDILQSLASSLDNDGVVVQLPLPGGFDIESFLRLIPQNKDIDCLSLSSMEAYARGEDVFSPPVALAVAEILSRNNIDPLSKRSAVVGYGNLVGRPVSAWLKNIGADFEVFDLGSDLTRLVEFDVVISGVGKPDLIQAEILKDGVVLIDAGTSEVGGRLSGDVSPDAYGKASLVTPVPGGVGPVTVVKLFENLLRSVRDR